MNWETLNIPQYLFVYYGNKLRLFFGTMHCTIDLHSFSCTLWHCDNILGLIKRTVMERWDCQIKFIQFDNKSQQMQHCNYLAHWNAMGTFTMKQSPTGTVGFALHSFYKWVWHGTNLPAIAQVWSMIQFCFLFSKKIFVLYKVIILVLQRKKTPTLFVYG